MTKTTMMRAGTLLAIGAVASWLLFLDGVGWADGGVLTCVLVAWWAGGREAKT